MRRHGGVANKPHAALVGAAATAQTVIAPTGIAYAQGESWSARSRDGSNPCREALSVVGVDGLELIVEPAGQPAMGDPPKRSNRMDALIPIA